MNNCLPQPGYIVYFGFFLLVGFPIMAVILAILDPWLDLFDKCRPRQ